MNNKHDNKSLDESHFVSTIFRKWKAQLLEDMPPFVAELTACKKFIPEFMHLRSIPTKSDEEYFIFFVIYNEDVIVSDQFMNII